MSSNQDKTVMDVIEECCCCGKTESLRNVVRLGWKSYDDEYIVCRECFDEDTEDVTGDDWSDDEDEDDDDNNENK